MRARRIPRPFARFDCSLPKHLRELALLMAARNWDAQYSWNAHVHQAIGAGVPEAAVKDGRFSATVANSPKVIDETAVKSTVDLLEKGEKGKVTSIPLTLITKGNVEEAPQYCSK
ncbi:hypothetical protein ACFYNZ_16925 [Streptomyces kebangsaanensis]|uniref:Periplasmic binding protein domain-containing protein n=1 Tax=Streptomyces kebangsaanensis TaxID=864058 RepID=A0ABW6KXP7_9ACTN